MSLIIAVRIPHAFETVWEMYLKRLTYLQRKMILGINSALRHSLMFSNSKIHLDDIKAF